MKCPKCRSENRDGAKFCNEGTINQFTGDGIMAIFGAPVAHEDHVQRACYASLAIQKALAEYAGRLKRDYDIEFKMRIGLNCAGPQAIRW